MSIAGTLLLVFLVLKLCGLIAWPWLWVLAPLWIPLALVLGAVVLVCCVLWVAMTVVWIFE